MDLFEEIQRLTNQLDLSVKQLRKSGTEYAEAERNYKICLREEALKLRAEENMAVTLINQIVYGIPEVARLRFERDIKEAVYDANKEAINSLKLKIRILERSNSKRMECYKMKKKKAEYMKGYYEKNKEKISQYYKEYYRKHREKLLKQHNDWNHAHQLEGQIRIAKERIEFWKKRLQELKEKK